MNETLEASLAILTHSVRELSEGQKAMGDDIKVLSKAMAQLAVFESNQAHQSDTIKRVFETVERLDLRVTQLEMNVPAAQRVHAWFDRLIFAAAGAMVLYVAHKLGLPITNLP